MRISGRHVASDRRLQIGNCLIAAAGLEQHVAEAQAGLRILRIGRRISRSAFSSAAPCNSPDRTSDSRAAVATLSLGSGRVPVPEALAPDE